MRILGLVQPLVLFLMVLVSGRVEAQAQPGPQPGSRLRVQTEAGRITATLVGRSADTLFLRPAGTSNRLSVRTQDISSAEESLGRPELSSLMLRRGLEGGGFGAVLWSIMGLMLGESIDTRSALLGAGLGAATGAVVALTEPRRERWRAVEIGVAPPP
jgi:hypothetical protein